MSFFHLHVSKEKHAWKVLYGVTYGVKLNLRCRLSEIEEKLDHLKTVESSVTEGNISNAGEENLSRREKEQNDVILFLPHYSVKSNSINLGKFPE